MDADEYSVRCFVWCICVMPYQRGLIYEVHKQKEKFIAWGLMKPLFNEREISYKAIIVSNKSIRQM